MKVGGSGGQEAKKEIIPVLATGQGFDLGAILRLPSHNGSGI